MPDFALAFARAHRAFRKRMATLGLLPGRHWRLKLFVDADFGGDALNVRSTSGGIIALAGPSTLFPLMWLAKRQASTARSTTESKVIALAEPLFHEAIPALDLWEVVLHRKYL